jgi:hypothetical protein
VKKEELTTSSSSSSITDFFISSSITEVQGTLLSHCCYTMNHWFVQPQWKA